MRTRLSFLHAGIGMRLVAGLLFGMGTTGCIVDIEDDDDCCSYTGCSGCNGSSYYYNDDTYYYDETYNDNSFDSTGSDSVVDTSPGDSEEGDTDSADVEPVDTETEEPTYFEQFECDEVQSDACVRTVCNGIEDYEDALLECEAKTCGCGYLEACLLVHIQCIQNACESVESPDSAAMVECGMDYALCINLCD